MTRCDLAAEKRLDFLAHPVRRILQPAQAVRVVRVIADREPPRADDHQTDARLGQRRADVVGEALSFANGAHIAEHGPVAKGVLEGGVELVHRKGCFAAAVAEEDAMARGAHGVGSLVDGGAVDLIARSSWQTLIFVAVSLRLGGSGKPVTPSGGFSVFSARPWPRRSRASRLRHSMA